MKEGCAMICCFCKQDEGVLPSEGTEARKPLDYMCPRCGHVKINEEAFDDLPSAGFTDRQLSYISIWLRNEYEKSDKKDRKIEITLDDLERIVKTYSPLDPIEKMDNALLVMDNYSEYLGSEVKLSLNKDYPHFHCVSFRELAEIFRLLGNSGYIYSRNKLRPYISPKITISGYERIRELKRKVRESRQCFVAMWFDPSMYDAYEKAIKPAIEYKEIGEIEPKYKALRIDKIEHTNDINDQVIAEIRRSRFMVCDLTGYRGGVYWEAGFAYGLGLEVIYTCEKGWVKPQVDQKSGNILREGIHFDLEHRNRIEWERNDLNEFERKLNDRIKAVII